MYLISLIIFVCFLIFLYFLYYVSHDDFVIVRKDIPMEKIFNLAVLAALFSLLIARLFYVLSNPSAKLLNPLGFLAFPYYPGLSLMGALVGAGVFIYFYCSNKKLPGGKIFDLFTIAFISVLPIGFLGSFIVLLGKTSLFFNLQFIYSIALLLLFVKLIYPFALKGEVKDGSTGLIFISIFSLLYFLTNLFLNIQKFSFVNPENILTLVALFASLILLINQEIMDKYLLKK